MQIVNISLNDLQPYENNPRKNDQAVDKVAKSIKQFGFKVPLVVDKNNVIIAGHTRYKASKKLGLKEVPCIIADDLNENQIKAFRIADNRVGQEAEWDFDLLQEELEELIGSFDLSELGFESEELDFMQEEIKIVEDDFDVELPEEPKTKLGDIYQLGNHILMCGNSTSIDDVKKLINGNKADIVFTDPPYGNGTSGKYGRGQLGVRTIKGDENLDVFTKVIESLEFERIVYFLQWRTLAESLEAISEKGLKINTVAVWDKKNAGLNGAGGISEQWEAVVFAGNIKYKKFGGNVFTVAREQHRREDSPHPHQKPIKLLAEIFAFIDECKSVFDPFGGSGSTLIACEQLNRTCYMMELDPKYVDVIIQRWENFTGKVAIKLN
jgi:DNA modification methylase